jgi:hypothetical protein
MTIATQDTHLTTSQPHYLTTFDSTCLIIGQLLMSVSTFFWNADGSYSINTATIVIMSMLFWATGLPGVFALFRDSNPWYARIGLLYAIYGCIGGLAFGFEGLFTEIFQSSDKLGVAAHEKFPLQMNLVLFWSGPAFPLSMLILGGFLMYRRKATVLTGVLLIIGALAFPVSRILRVEWIGHVADVVLLSGIVLLVGKSAISQSPTHTTL